MSKGVFIIEWMLFVHNGNKCSIVRKLHIRSIPYDIGLLITSCNYFKKCMRSGPIVDLYIDYSMQWPKNVIKIKIWTFHTQSIRAKANQTMKPWPCHIPLLLYTRTKGKRSIEAEYMFETHYISSIKESKIKVSLNIM